MHQHPTPSTLTSPTPPSPLFAVVGDGVTIFSQEQPQHRLRLLTRFHPTPLWLSALAWSPDGRALAYGGAHCQVGIWGRARKQNWVTQRYEGPILALAWSPLGEHLAVCSGRTLLLQSLHEGRRVVRPLPAGGAVLAWQPRGEALACASADGALGVWDAQQLQTASPHHPTWHLEGLREITALSWRPGPTRQLAIATPNGVLLWTLGEKEARLAYGRHQDVVTGLAWSPDGTMLASASRDGNWHLWRPNAQKARIVSAQKCRTPIRSLTWSPDGAMIATAHPTGAVSLWEGRKEGAFLDTLPLPTQPEPRSAQLAWSPLAFS